MLNRVHTFGLSAVLALSVMSGALAQGVSQAFTYQGFLRDGGNPANGNYTMTFRIYNALTGGTLLWDSGALTVNVNNGLFTVQLNAPASVWSGAERFLEIQVGSTTLSPRVKINPTPYAIRAVSAGTANPIGAAGGDLSGAYPNPTVAQLQGRPVSAAAPSNGQVLKWTGTMWAPGSDDGGGLTLPFSGSANVGSGAVFSIKNTTPSVSPGGEAFGVFGEATATSGETNGGYFVSASPSGTGVFGFASASSGSAYGVFGFSRSTDGRGVFGHAIATSGTTYGGYFWSSSTSGTGVFGWASTNSGGAVGVWGQTSSSASNAYGVYGSEPSGGAGHSVYAVGTLAATGTKSFQIDHPLMPETHYLNHFCTEAPEPLNAYSGNVVTDAQGYATIQLPDYFESINRDFRYQLTVIDGSDDFVLAKVVREIQNNRFVIRTNKPFVKVSWRVEAIRNDLYLQRYGYQTEQEKEDAIKGKYLHPELYGQPKERGIHYRPEPERPNEGERPTEMEKP